MLRFLFRDEPVDAMLAWPRTHEFSAEHALVELVREAAARRAVRVHVSGRDFSLDACAKAGGEYQSEEHRWRSRPTRSGTPCGTRRR